MVRGWLWCRTGRGAGGWWGFGRRCGGPRGGGGWGGGPPGRGGAAGAAACAGGFGRGGGGGGGLGVCLGGGGGGGAVLVELEHVAGEVDEAPFVLGGRVAAAAEAGDRAVVFFIAEDGLDHPAALGVGAGALGGAQQVFHLFDRCRVGGRRAPGVAV